MSIFVTKYKDKKASQKVAIIFIPFLLLKIWEKLSFEEVPTQKPQHC